MTFIDALRSAVGALAANWLRSVLTMVGVVIGVAAVIAVVAVGSGARGAIQKQIESLGSNLVVVTAGSAVQGGIRLGVGSLSTLADDDAVDIAREVDDVLASAPFIRTQAQVIGNGTNASSSIFGVDNQFLEAREWRVKVGRAFDDEEIRRGGEVALIGKTLGTTLFGDVDPVGQDVIVRGVPLRIIGVMVSKGQSMLAQDQDDVLMAPLDLVRRRIAGRSTIQARSIGAILVRFEDGTDLDSAGEQIRSLIRQRHRLSSDEEDDFQIRNLTEVMNTVASSTDILSALLAAVAAISLMVGGVGIMNIMLVSVTERTREIGLRLALGARRSDVLVQFLIEAVTLSSLGGAVGVVLGGGMAMAISVFADWPALVAAPTVLLAVGFAVLVGVAFGLYPAIRASRLDPIDALRRN